MGNFNYLHTISVIAIVIVVGVPVIALEGQRSALVKYYVCKKNSGMAFSFNHKEDPPYLITTAILC